jgi:TPR repeat protein
MSKSLYEQAKREMKLDNPNIKLVIELLNNAINDGDAKAAYALATWYLHGKNVRKNTKKAVELLQQAARDNTPEACFDLAVFFEKEKSSLENKKIAFHFYLKAAIRNDAQAIYEVGRCYYYGIGTRKDKSIADIWLERAQELGITQ